MKWLWLYLVATIWQEQIDDGGTQMQPKSMWTVMISGLKGKVLDAPLFVLDDKQSCKLTLIENRIYYVLQIVVDNPEPEDTLLQFLRDKCILTATLLATRIYM